MPTSIWIESNKIEVGTRRGRRTPADYADVVRRVRVVEFSRQSVQTPLQYRVVAKRPYVPAAKDELDQRATKVLQHSGEWVGAAHAGFQSQEARDWRVRWFGLDPCSVGLCASLG